MIAGLVGMTTDYTSLWECKFAMKYELIFVCIVPNIMFFTERISVSVLGYFFTLVEVIAIYVFNVWCAFSFPLFSLFSIYFSTTYPSLKTFPQKGQHGQCRRVQAHRDLRVTVDKRNQFFRFSLSIHH